MKYLKIQIFQFIFARTMIDCKHSKYVHMHPFNNGMIAVQKSIDENARSAVTSGAISEDTSVQIDKLSESQSLTVDVDESVRKQIDEHVRRKIISRRETIRLINKRRHCSRQLLNSFYICTRSLDAAMSLRNTFTVVRYNLAIWTLILIESNLLHS